MKGSQGRAFRVTTAVAPVGSTPGHTITIQIAIDVSQKEALLARFRWVFWVIILGALAIFFFWLSDCATAVTGQRSGQIA
jgi:two-component system heavy metal sensor histidine kinase CusS